MVPLLLSKKRGKKKKKKKKAFWKPSGSHLLNIKHRCEQKRIVKEIYEWLSRPTLRKKKKKGEELDPD